MMTPRLALTDQTKLRQPAHLHRGFHREPFALRGSANLPRSPFTISTDLPHVRRMVGGEYRHKEAGSANQTDS
jgi:hypothetical protein